MQQEEQPQVQPKSTATPVFRNQLLGIGKKKTFVSKYPGYSLTLSNGIALNNGKTRIVFDSFKGKEFSTNEIPIIEHLKTHPKFGEPGVPNENGVQTEFYYSPTPEEVAAELAAIEAKKHIEFIKSQPGLTLDLSKYNDIQLRSLAKQCAVETVVIKKGKSTKRSGDDIREDLEILFADESDAKALAAKAEEKAALAQEAEEKAAENLELENKKALEAAKEATAKAEAKTAELEAEIEKLKETTKNVPVSEVVGPETAGNASKKKEDE